MLGKGEIPKHPVAGMLPGRIEKRIPRRRAMAMGIGLVLSVREISGPAEAKFPVTKTTRTTKARRPRPPRPPR
jgi:hypothetical protein